MLGHRNTQWLAVALSATALLVAAPASAEMSAEDLAKLAQDPIGNVVSLPFQNDTNFGVGPLGGTQNVLYQPVVNYNFPGGT